MICIINLNMAIDKTVKIDNFSKGKTYRFLPDLNLAGGKGVNVARVLKNFNSNYVLCGFLSGFTGKLILEKLKDERFKYRMFYQNSDESRICLTVLDKNGENTDLNEEGPSITKETQDDFINYYLKNLKKFSVISISGRTPRNINILFYRKIVSNAKKHQIPVFVDLTGKYLYETIKNGAYSVKINSDEFKDLTGNKAFVKNITDAYRKFRKYGLKILIITDKSKPFYAVIENNIYRITPPVLKNFISGVGAGDSFMAGLIHSFTEKYNPEKLLKFSTACSVSDCLTLGAGIINKKTVKKFYSEIKVEKIMEVR